MAYLFEESYSDSLPDFFFAFLVLVIAFLFFYGSDVMQYVQDVLVRMHYRHERNRLVKKRWKRQGVSPHLR
jgi:hypothetical protein